MAITIDQATADKTGATARAFAAQNKANRTTNTSPITIDQAIADKTGATARAFSAQNKANTTPNASIGNTITGANTKPVTPMNVTQPQIATGSTLLASDIISKGQADTARAMAEEARIAQQQGTPTPSVTSDVIKNILQSSGTPTNTSPQGTQGVTEATNVNGITADTLASQRQGIQDAITGQATRAGLTGAAYSEAVDPARKELNEINARINDEALAGRRRAEAVLTIPGITKAQAQDKINEINRVNASQLADLAVVQMAKQGQFDSAREIADRAIEAKLEEQKNRNQALLFTYQENKELFTKAEQRAFEAEQKKRDREYETEKQTLKQISDLSLSALESGAPTSVVSRMQKAKTVAEATSIGGQYVGKVARDYTIAQTNKLRADANATSIQSTGAGNVVSGPNAQALSVILGSGKFTKDQANAVTRAINNGEDPTTVIKNQAKNLMNAADASKVQNLETAKGAIADLDASLKAYYAAGGKTNILSGNYEKVLNKLGTLNNPELVKIGVQIASNLQSYRNAVSGTAYSEQEGADIASIFPGINKTQGLNTAIIQGRISSMDSNINNAYRSVLGSAYDALDQSSQSQPTVSQPIITPEKETIFNQVLRQTTPAPVSQQTTSQSQPTVGRSLFGDQAYTPTIDLTKFLK